MKTSFKVSLLYLLLIIPRYGNSPLPVMESWVKKDQDDGFVQRDMTSSLTGGDESFGSAHQTYQNSLIRKKKSDTSGGSLPTTGYRKFSVKFDRNQKLDQPNMFYNNRFNDYSGQLENSNDNSAVFEEFDGETGLPSSKFHSKSMNVRNAAGENFNPRLTSKFNSDKYVDIVPSKDVVLYNTRLRHARGDSERNPHDEDGGADVKWSMCKSTKERYAPNPQIPFPQSVPLEDRNGMNFAREVSLQENYPAIDDDRRIGDINNQEYKDNFQPNEADGKNPQLMDESDYYDVEPNQVPGEDSNSEDEDYSQMLNEHSFIQKRDEARQQVATSNTENQNRPSPAAKVVVDAIKTRDVPSDTENDAASLQNGQEELSKSGVKKVRDVDSSRSGTASDVVWNSNPNLQSKAIHDVVKNSQRALQEVQQLQQKASRDGNEGLKRESRNQPLFTRNKEYVRFDDRRLKREDEDEQKNMKTGTDEGGGGEYEDEEGKGHKDEEEYYEDADLSESDPKNEIQSSEDANQRYVKREVAKGVQSQNSKEEQSEESNSQDYELNLENAPVENDEKSKKSFFHEEGEKAKKNSARKGVKIWDQWGKWSPCSVTCGVGRSTRWRHCIGGGCAQGEKEAQIKRCTNPAC